MFQQCKHHVHNDDDNLCLFVFVFLFLFSVCLVRLFWSNEWNKWECFDAKHWCFFGFGFPFITKIPYLHKNIFGEKKEKRKESEVSHHINTGEEPGAFWFFNLSFRISVIIFIKKNWLVVVFACSTLKPLVIIISVINIKYENRSNHQKHILRTDTTAGFVWIFKNQEKKTKNQKKKNFKM